MFIVLLDNGHGSNTLGKCSPKKNDGSRFREYKFARTVVLNLRLKLMSMGYKVFIITPEDTDVNLNERVRRINKIVALYGAGNCLLISIHVDAAGYLDKWLNARGWSAYTTRRLNNSDKLAEFLYDAAENILGNDPVVKNSYAGEMQKLFRKDTTDGDKDKEEDFFIIKHADCPAVLTENLFQDNKKDVELLESLHGVLLIVNLHAEGIEKYVKSIGKK